MSANRDPRIDAYIAKAAPFAQPILNHLRQRVHQGCPEAVETIKWGFPHFLHAGAILCSMAAFKTHCVFGFRHQGMPAVLGRRAAKQDEAMGSFGRITTLADLPPDREMRRYLRAAVALQASGKPARPPRSTGTARPEPAMPPELAHALQRAPKVAGTFADLSPSHRREYLNWIAEAKRPETRARRVATTLEWLRAGKSSHRKDERA